MAAKKNTSLLALHANRNPGTTTGISQGLDKFMQMRKPAEGGNQGQFFNKQGNAGTFFNKAQPQ
jgi:hypothetical protein